VDPVGLRQLGDLGDEVEDALVGGRGGPRDGGSHAFVVPYARRRPMSRGVVVGRAVAGRLSATDVATYWIDLRGVTPVALRPIRLPTGASAILDQSFGVPCDERL
jgi:hypothetical protein